MCAMCSVNMRYDRRLNPGINPRVRRKRRRQVGVLQPQKDQSSIGSSIRGSHLKIF
jgi:hypothetical protein